MWAIPRKVAMNPSYSKLLARIALAVAFAAFLGSGLTPLAGPGVAQASQAIGRTAEDSLFALINNARVANHLVPLRLDTRLRDLAEYRAGVMASTNTMSHTIAGNLSSELTARGIQWYSEGECIAWDTYAYPTDAINFVFQAWHDAGHWPLLMSTTFNYAGIGIVHTSSGKTWASMVFTESVDHTRPWAHISSVSRSGTTVTWRWSGGDYALQTHTAGFKNFDVEYRVGTGTWSIIRAGTTATYLTLTNRAHGRYYGVRVRSRDNRGNLSSWTIELRIYVP